MKQAVQGWSWLLLPLLLGVSLVLGMGFFWSSEGKKTEPAKKPESS